MNTELLFSLAPMEGITTFVYRNAYAHHYGYVDRYYSPFLANQTLSYKDVNDVCPENNRDIHLIPQILTNNSEVFLSIASQLKDYGYKEVNFNLGCPSGTVVTKHRGAGFLADLAGLTAFFDEIFSKCELDISVKTRIGISSMEEWDKILEVYKQFPIKELIIHPRLQKDFYKGKPHPKAYQKAEEVLSAPLCYNGDILGTSSVHALTALCPETKHIMIGRGILQNPLLPKEIKEESASFALSDAEKRRFMAFHDEIVNGYEELMDGDRPALFRLKELWSYMGSFLDLSEKQVKILRKSNTLREYRIAARQIIC